MGYSDGVSLSEPHTSQMNCWFVKPVACMSFNAVIMKPFSYLPTTTLCGNDDEEAFKYLLAGIIHAFVYCSKTLWHMNDTILPFEVH